MHGESVLPLARDFRTFALSHFRTFGIKTVLGVCDLVDLAMAEATDATATIIDYFKSLYHEQLQSKIFVVHDGIEHPELTSSTLPERNYMISLEMDLKAQTTKQVLLGLMVSVAPIPMQQTTTSAPVSSRSIL